MNATPPIVRTVSLAGFVLPAKGALLRDHTRTPARRTAHYLEHFDRTTLFYDLVWQEKQGRLLMTAPPLANLWAALRRGLHADGRRVRPARSKKQKYDQIILPTAQSLCLTLENVTYHLSPRADISEIFSGLNCAVTMNRNNPLDWIRTWADHHSRMHRLEGVLIFDNGSDAYTPQMIADSLAEVTGLRAVVVASAPYPYGTTDPVQHGERRENYLQPALLNLARNDILRRARAVLNVDIDELVLARNGRSVFDHAAHSLSGLARLPVYWAHPRPGTDGPAPQSDHIYRTCPKQRTPRKWCVRPRYGLGALPWHVHHVGGEVFKLVPETTQHEVVHCRAASIGWHGFKARFSDPDAIFESDQELAELWTRAAGLQ